MKRRTPAPTLAQLRVFPGLSAGGRHASDGRLIAGPLSISCLLGRSGIVRSKREGDGGTPAGRFALLEVRYRGGPGRRPRVALPLRLTRPTDGWCDDPQAPAYNRPVRLPLNAGHEKMWRGDRLYDLVVVLDYNLFPRKRGHGSAIFFHLTGEDGKPTAGCVAISPADMRRLLPRLSPRTVMTIA